MAPSASTAHTTSPAEASVRSRLLSTIIGMTRTRETQFDPARFTGAPSTRKAFEPPRKARRAANIVESDFQGWPVFSVAPRSGATTGSVLYLHGGAWAAEIRAGHWTFVAALAAMTGRTFVVPIYPLVPAITHADINPVLVDLWESLAGGGPVALMGDSAGATMVMNLLRSLPSGTHRPDTTILLSPTLDLTLSNPDIAAVAPRDPLLRADHLRALGKLYAGADGVESPTVNPMQSDLDGIGRVHVFTGTRDILNPDAHRFAARASSATDAIVTVHERPEMLHDWMLMPIPEAAATIRAVSTLLRG